MGCDAAFSKGSGKNFFEEVKMDVIQMTPGNKDGQQRAIGKEELLGEMKGSIKELQ